MPDSYMDKLCPQGPSGEGFDPLAKVDNSAIERLGKMADNVQRAIERKRNGTVVFDIDGVLSDSRWRLPLIREKGGEAIIENRGQLDGGWDKEQFPDVGVMLGDREERWSKFYGLMPWDTAYEPGVELLRQMRRIYNIEFWTGRPEWTRDMTVKWIIEQDLLPGEAASVVSEMSPQELHDWSKVWLCMRPNQSRRKAHELKTNYMLALQDEDIPNPVLVIDDDPEVVYAFGLYGVPSLLAIWHGEGVERVRG